MAGLITAPEDQICTQWQKFKIEKDIIHLKERSTTVCTKEESGTGSAIMGLLINFMIDAARHILHVPSKTQMGKFTGSPTAMRLLPNITLSFRNLIVSSKYIDLGWNMCLSKLSKNPTLIRPYLGPALGFLLGNSKYCLGEG